MKSKFDLMVESLKRDVAKNNTQYLFNDDVILYMANIIKSECNNSDEIYDMIMSLESKDISLYFNPEEILKNNKILSLSLKLNRIAIHLESHSKDKNALMRMMHYSGILTVMLAKILIDK